MEIPTLKAKTRPERGKGPARRTRSAGHVPAVLYGKPGDPLSIQLDAREFGHLLQHHAGEQMVVMLDMEDNAELNSPAFLKVVQHHPLRGDVEHVDFIRIRLDERIVVSVPLTLTGRPKGVTDEGGVLDQQLRELEIECLATEIPDEITVDVADMGMEDSIHVSDIQVPEGITFITDLDRAVAAVHAPRVVKSLAEEEAELAEAEAAEEAEAEAAAEEED